MAEIFLKLIFLRVGYRVYLIKILNKAKDFMKNKVFIKMDVVSFNSIIERFIRKKLFIGLVEKFVAFIEELKDFK